MTTATTTNLVSFERGVNSTIDELLKAAEAGQLVLNGQTYDAALIEVNWGTPTEEINLTTEVNATVRGQGIKARLEILVHPRTTRLMTYVQYWNIDPQTNEGAWSREYMEKPKVGEAPIDKVDTLTVVGSMDEFTVLHDALMESFEAVVARKQNKLIDRNGREYYQIEFPIDLGLKVQPEVFFSGPMYGSLYCSLKVKRSVKGSGALAKLAQKNAEKVVRIPEPMPLPSELEGIVVPNNARPEGRRSTAQNPSLCISGDWVVDEGQAQTGDSYEIKFRQLLKDGVVSQDAKDLILAIIAMPAASALSAELGVKITPEMISPNAVSYEVGGEGPEVHDVDGDLDF